MHPVRWLLLAPFIILLPGGCANFPGQSAGKPMQTYMLAPAPAVPAPSPTTATGPVLLVSTPQAEAGYDGRRMAYTERPFELRYFASNSWADDPARMLEPLLVRRLEALGKYRAVITPGAGADAGLRLDTWLEALVQEFQVTPAQVRIVLRVQLTDLAGRRILASERIETTAPTPSADPYGGVIAANRALEQALDRVADICAGATGE
jgi:cholesterol transport system auxiliary component